MTLPAIGRSMLPSTEFRMYPTFRPDKALRIGIPDDVERLGRPPAGGEPERKFRPLTIFSMRSGSVMISSMPTAADSPIMV